MSVGGHPQLVDGLLPFSLAKQPHAAKLAVSVFKEHVNNRQQCVLSSELKFNVWHKAIESVNLVQVFDRQGYDDFQTIGSELFWIPVLINAIKLCFLEVLLWYIFENPTYPEVVRVNTLVYLLPVFFPYIFLLIEVILYPGVIPLPPINNLYADGFFFPPWNMMIQICPHVTNSSKIFLMVT